MVNENAAALEPLRINRTAERNLVIVDRVEDDDEVNLHKYLSCVSLFVNEEIYRV
jgi:cob(I)alamin adenosyltransferase